MEIVSNANTFQKMYRYLLKYVGTYRVKAEYDQNTNDFPRNENGQIEESFEDLYIPCKNNILIKHTYIGDDILVCCFYEKIKTANNIYDKIMQQYPNIDIEFEDSAPDGFIYFHAKDLKKLATILKPITTGKGINPFSKKNLPKPEYKIPSKDLSQLYKLTQDFDRSQTLQFFKKSNSEFLDMIFNEKKSYKNKFKSSGLNSREFIHSIGVWDRYINYIQNQISKN